MAITTIAVVATPAVNASDLEVTTDCSSHSGNSRDGTSGDSSDGTTAGWGLGRGRTRSSSRVASSRRSHRRCDVGSVLLGELKERLDGPWEGRRVEGRAIGARDVARRRDALDVRDDAIPPLGAHRLGEHFCKSASEGDAVAGETPVFSRHDK
ncbi:hypothetical protein Ae201684P_003539 [Aphanomyces euteiches]|nr:hypothetical protein Ae201684P_003539 [Aphanomyces euteiches]KAH9148146.1 hypothetical protein AeRB84_008400 [Aphanomyces euteiches]